MKRRILVVDDEPSLLRLLQVTLENEGYEVFLAGDGETALRRVTTEEPDLVLLDVMMPMQDGWQVLEEMVEAPRRSKVICLTAKDSRRDQVKGWRTGADDYVTKPFRVEELLALIPEVLERTPGQQEERRREALKHLGEEDV